MANLSTRRVRSAQFIRTAHTLTGSFTPALVSGCTATVPATPGRAYVGVYPD